MRFFPLIPSKEFVIDKAIPTVRDIEEWLTVTLVWVGARQAASRKLCAAGPSNPKAFETLT